MVIQSDWIICTPLLHILMACVAPSWSMITCPGYLSKIQGYNHVLGYRTIFSEVCLDFIPEKKKKNTKTKTKTKKTTIIVGSTCA